MNRLRHRQPRPLARYSVYPVAYYLTNSLCQSYMSLYYQALGCDAGRIGAISAGAALAGMAAQPAWGALADRLGHPRRLASALALAAAAAAWALGRLRAFWALMALACMFSIFYASLQPLGDALLLRALNRRSLPFGPVRLAGAAAFALGGAAFGRLLGAPGRATAIPLYVTGLCLLTGAAAFTLPNDGDRPPPGPRAGLRALLRQRELMALIGFMLPVQMTMGYFYAFFSPHFLSLEGGTGARLGLCWMIATASQAPFLLVSDRLLDRWGPWPLMRFSAAVLALRWLILGACPGVGAAMASQLLHGGGFIVMSVCMAKYVSRTVPRFLQATGQALLAMVSGGLSRAFGSLAGGLLANALGRQRVFLYAAGLCAVMAVAGATACKKVFRAQENGTPGGVPSVH